MSTPEQPGGGAPPSVGTFASQVQKSGTSWKFLLVVGILAAIAGVVAIVVPVAASVTVALFIGWLFLFAAVLFLIDAFAGGGAGRVAGRLILTILAVIAGVYLITQPLNGTFTLTVILVIYFIAIGVVRIISGIGARGVPGAGLVIFSGVISLILGLLIGFDLPSSSAWAIGLLVGIDFLFSGLTLIMTAFALRKA